jgi:acyl carrier protein
MPCEIVPVFGGKARGGAIRSANQHFETRTSAMPSTFETVARIIAVPIERITPDSHVMKDLEVDSLGFLDVVFEIDKTFSIRLPVEEWLQNVQGGYDGDNYFVLSNLCDYIDQTAGSVAEV